MWLVHSFVIQVRNYTLSSVSRTSQCMLLRGIIQIGKELERKTKGLLYSILLQETEYALTV